MEVYRGISPFELRAIRCSGLILSTDSKWAEDLTWQSSRTRTFFTRNREQADLFAIGAYISGYGATGHIIRRYLIGRRDRSTSRAYTLQVGIPESLLRADTEFAERGDDELYTTAPISIKYVQHVYMHRVWLSRIEENRILAISTLTTEVPLKRILGLPSRSIELPHDSALLSQDIPPQEREFWLEVALDGSTYICVAALFDGILTRFESLNT